MFNFLLFIYVLGVVLFAAIYLAFCAIAAVKFCNKHPDTTLPKTRSYTGWVKFTAVAFCPVVHYLFLVVLICAWDEVMEKTLAEIEADTKENT